MIETVTAIIPNRGSIEFLSASRKDTPPYVLIAPPIPSDFMLAVGIIKEGLAIEMMWKKRTYEFKSDEARASTDASNSVDASGEADELATADADND